MASPNLTTVKRKPPIVATLITLVAVVIMFALGEWQLQRAEDKKQRLESVQQRQLLSPLSIEEINTMKGDIRDLPFAAEGVFTVDKYFLLDNKIHQGKVGYQVVAPMQTEHQVLLVNLGWVQAPQTRDQLPQISLPTDSIVINGVSSLPSNNPMINETAMLEQDWPVVLQQTDLDLMAIFVGQPILPFVMLLSPEHPLGWEREWTPVVMSPEKHLGYAIQWFLLALACVIIYFVALKRRKTTTDE